MPVMAKKTKTAKRMVRSFPFLPILPFFEALC
jgi:hypothetical protein